MNKLATRALWTAALAGGLWAAGTGVASAAGTDGSEGLGSGNEAVVSISTPITVGGNAVGLLGDAESTDSSAKSSPTPSADVSTSGIDGVLSGTAALVAIDAPITVGGNAIGVLGDASSESSTTSTEASQPSGGTTSGDDGLLSGTVGVVDIAAPVTLGGNAVAVLGDASSEGSTMESSSSGGQAGWGGAMTSGDDGVLSGTQVVADVLAPVTAGGNAVAVLGDASSEGSTVESSSSAGSGGATTSGDDGVLSGTQVVADVLAPVTAGGNAVAVLGDASSESSDVESGAISGGSDGATTSGDDGLLSGTQVVADVLAPVTAGGNAVAVLGAASSEGSTVDSSPGTGGSDGTTGGDDGLASGGQIGVDVLAPITIGGNAIGVIGDATSTGSTTTDPTAPIVPTEPTEPGEPTEPTQPGEPMTPENPGEQPGAPADGVEVGSEFGADLEKGPVLASGVEAAGSGDSRAALQRSDAAAQLPRTGLDDPEVLLPALAMLALGVLLLVGARRVRSMQ